MRESIFSAYLLIVAVFHSIPSGDAWLLVGTQSSEVEVVRKWCQYDIDSYNCLNINCNKVKRIKTIPESIAELLANFSTETFSVQNRASPVLCSIDLTETGITSLNAETFDHFDMLLLELIRLNSNQSQTDVKLFLSNLDEIREFKMPHYHNIALFIRDSNIRSVQPKALSKSGKLELNLIGIFLLFPFESESFCDFK